MCLHMMPIYGMYNPQYNYNITRTITQRRITMIPVILTADQHISELHVIGQTVIPDDGIFKEVANKIQLFAKHKGQYVSNIEVSRLGCNMTRLYYPRVLPEV